MNIADSAWMLISTALVLFMVPGLALFYGGLVGEKNVIAMMTESLVAIGIVTVLWVVVGYSLVFGANARLEPGTAAIPTPPRHAPPRRVSRAHLWR
jgi:Amt family ammonium transporter